MCEIVQFLYKKYSLTMNTERLKQKLQANINNLDDSACWIWKGQISNSGRGRITIKDSKTGFNKVVSAETASYLAFKGELDEGELVKQQCGNRLCINPDHLELLNLSDLQQK